MNLDVSPLAGWRYSHLETRCTLDRSLFTGDAPLAPAFRGCCWNTLTKCLLICDPEQCCVRIFRVSAASDDVSDSTSASASASASAAAASAPLLRFTPNTNMERIGDRGAGAGKFLLPVAVDVNARGEIAVADAKLSRVQVFMGSGALQYYFGRPGGSRGEFHGLSDLKFTLLGHLAIADAGNHRVQIMTQTGGIVAIIGKFGWRAGEFDSPCALAVARSGELYVCDQGNKRIQRLSAKGKVLAVWGSMRQRHHRRRSSSTSLTSLSGTVTTATVSAGASGDVDALGNPVSLMLYSVFDTPSGIAIGVNGEVIVCDSGPQSRVLIFSDAGACRHVLSCPTPWQVIAISYCGASLVTILRSSLLPEGIVAPSDSSGNREGVRDTSDNAGGDAPHPVFAYALTAYPAPERIVVGKLAAWPVRCVVQMVKFLTYVDALEVRRVNRFLHRICRALRNAWQLAPLTPGTATVRKYSRVVAPATGLVAVNEAFDRWGLRVFKPAHRVRRHVMDFDAGFCNAVSALHGAMFHFQHEDILRALFEYHARGHGEIDRAAFVEIATVIEEVRAGLLKWEQCVAFQRSDKHSDCDRSARVPNIRDMRALPIVASGTPSSAQLPASLQFVESAQTLQMNKLLLKLRSL